MKKIFHRFYQSKGDSRYPVYGQSGTGIGLYLCQKIVSLLNGKIEAKSNRTKGTSFRILLPLKREEGNAISAEEQRTYIYEDIKEEETAAIEKHPNGQKMTILVVEDNNDMRNYIRSILIEYYKVLEAGNGEEALKVLREKVVDFIISDLMMPVMDGLELSQKVKADFSISHIPFLMLTAKTSTEARISSYKMGADEFLQKPFDEELLLTRINNILETRKTYQRKFSMHMDIDELNVQEESKDEKVLRKAIETVKDNYRDSYYEVGDFTEAMGVSKSLLNKKMQTLTGQSAGHFIRNYRLNLAHEMILKTNGSMTISEIAYEVGFNDPKYFTRCFTKHFGIAPSSLSKGNK